MGDTITPAFELASEAAGYDSSASENRIAHLDWGHMTQSYDQDYEAQVASIEDRMQRYHVSSTTFATAADP
jgi:hypothetical protein